MASGNTFDISAEVQKIMAWLSLLPAQQKKDILLMILDRTESNFKQNNIAMAFTGKLDALKQSVSKEGVVKLSFPDYGKSEITTLFQIAGDADKAWNEKHRRKVFYVLLATYSGIALIFFFINLTSSSIKPLVTSSVITIIAWIVVSLLYSTTYFLLNNICEIICRPLNKYTFKIFVVEYTVGFMLSMLAANVFFAGSFTFLLSRFIIPHLYPFIITTIKGIIALNFGSILTSFISIVIFVLTTINSIVQIRQLIREIIGKNQDANQRGVLQEINKKM